MANINKDVEAEKAILQEQERTSINKKLFLQFLEKSHGFILIVCDKINISRSIVYHWRKKDKDFKKAMDNILHEREDILLDRLYGKAMSGDIGAMKYYLSYTNRGKEKIPDRKVHIYHHVSEKSQENPPITLEDILELDELILNDGTQAHNKLWDLFGNKKDTDDSDNKNDS